MFMFISYAFAMLCFHHALSVSFVVGAFSLVSPAFPWLVLKIETFLISSEISTFFVYTLGFCVTNV